MAYGWFRKLATAPVVSMCGHWRRWLRPPQRLPAAHCARLSPDCVLVLVSNCLIIEGIEIALLLKICKNTFSIIYDIKKKGIGRSDYMTHDSDVLLAHEVSWVKKKNKTRKFNWHP